MTYFPNQPVLCVNNTVANKLSISAAPKFSSAYQRDMLLWLLACCLCVTTKMAAVIIWRR